MEDSNKKSAYEDSNDKLIEEKKEGGGEIGSEVKIGVQEDPLTAQSTNDDSNNKLIEEKKGGGGESGSEVKIDVQENPVAAQSFSRIWRDHCYRFMRFWMNLESREMRFWIRKFPWVWRTRIHVAFGLLKLWMYWRHCMRALKRSFGD